MSLLRQVDILPAGCQPWNIDVCAASNERFAYCSTLAIYIYKFDSRYNEYKLESIMSEHRKTITTISWSPFDSDIFVSSSVDPKICVWNVKTQSLVTHYVNTRGVIPGCIRWHPKKPSTISFICGRGPLHLLNIESSFDSREIFESAAFLSDVSMFSWNRLCNNKIAFGHVDGSISILWMGEKISKHELKPVVEGMAENYPVACLKWDNLSSDYLLVLNSNHGVRLIDTENMFMVMHFQLPSSAACVSSLAWIPSASGMFVTGDSQNGILRIWNVSRASPLENINLKKTGFHTICLVPRKSCENNHSLSWNSHISSTSIAQNPPTSPNTNSSWILPSADLLCTFNDGGVGVFNVERKKWSFLHPLGHTETIFSCEFQPENPDMLATASFDGTVKVWDITKMKAVSASTGNEGVIYSLTWSPGDMKCIACATAKKGIFVWDVTKGRIVNRFLEHGGMAVFCVSWNQKEPQLLASTCNGGLCIIRNIQAGQVIQKYKHPRAVYGCEWSPNNRDMIATSCEDHNIRIFYITTNTDKPLRVFKGHTAKAFHIRWSILRDGFLCSASDDMTVRLWDYTEEECVGILKGHTAPVRGLLWNPEIPYLLLSGSWDYTIRVWDTRTFCCLEVVTSHGADVYGLACHPQRPFLVASTSRDSTVRLWSLAHLVQKVSLTILAYGATSDILGTIDNGMDRELSPLLCGQYAREIILGGPSKENPTDLLLQKRILESFAFPRGFRNLWDLMSVICGHDIGVLSPSYKDGVVHVKHLVPLKSSEAQELEIIKMSNFGSGGSQRKHDQLRAAANIHLKIGDMQRYCELMVEIGEWDKALSFAPTVSLEYWKSLMVRRGNQLIKENNESCASYCLATDNIEKLCEFYTGRCEFHNAILVAAAASKRTNNNQTTISENHLNKLSLANGTDIKRNKKQEPGNVDSHKLLTKSLSSLADWHFENNRPVVAACCFLAMDDVKNAMSLLLRSNELENGYLLGRVLKTDEELFKLFSKYLSRRCEKHGRWEMAVDLLKKANISGDDLWMLCARSSCSEEENAIIYEKAGVPSPKECFEKAEEYLEKQEYFEAMKYYLTSSTPEHALDIGLNLLRDVFLRELWHLNDVDVILNKISNIKTEKLQGSKLSRHRNDLLIASAYIGALKAMQRKYTPIVILLLTHARYLINKEKSNLPISGLQIEKETKAWLMYNPISSVKIECEDAQEIEDLKKTWSDLKRRIGTSTLIHEEGVVMVVGSFLPNNSAANTSFLTKEPIKGPVHLLEDGKSMISLNNALMWARVNPFSPLASGARINPF